MQAKKEMEAIKSLNEKIAGIVESGSNENGSWVKFADGTMICTLVTTITDQAINQPYVNLYQGTRVWTFPVPFVERPAVSCSEFTYGTSSSWGLIRECQASYARLNVLDVVSREAGTNTRISAIAIGRWK